MLLIPLSHFHNVTWLAPLDIMSSIPAAITPFNGASIPVESVWNTTVTMPLSSLLTAGLNCTISYNVAVAVSPSSVLMVSFPKPDDVVNEMIAVPLLVVLMVCVVLGRVRVPFPENVKVACVWFIGVMFGSGERSSKIGWGDNSIPDDEEDVVAVVLLVVVVVAAAGVAMFDVKTNDDAIVVVIIAANISAVPVVVLLRCVISLATTNTIY